MTARGRVRWTPVARMGDPPPPSPPTSLDALPALPYALVWTPPPPGSTASDPLAGTGAYAIFDARARLRYVGYAKALRPRLALHGRRVPAACHAVKVYPLPPEVASAGRRMGRRDGQGGRVRRRARGGRVRRPGWRQA